MTDSLDIVLRLTQQQLPASQRRRALNDFARVNGWQPSDEIEYPSTDSIANGHLIVEHGLENAVVISFLRHDIPFKQLPIDDKHKLLGISYNNLIEWHFFPNIEGLTIVYNRLKPIQVKYISRHDKPDTWRAEAFEAITGRRPNPNIKSLDDALMSTLSLWKRRLSGELRREVTNQNISALFNSILLIRALEDHRRWENPNSDYLLIMTWQSMSRRAKSIRQCLKKALSNVVKNGYPGWLMDDASLKIFDKLDESTIEHLFRDFYINRAAPYEYDFSLMSKHALSRIYEHYVSLLRDVKKEQISFFPELPEEKMDTSFGGIYTPQYIARFFCRFLKANVTPNRFKSLTVIDPACGSGIFPRTLAELQNDPWASEPNSASTVVDFNNIVGIDIDENACHAARLSLSLLHLVLTDSLPRELKIINAEAIGYFMRNTNLRNSFDVAMTNPPFIPWDRIPNQWRLLIRDLLGQAGIGKIDVSLAFLKLGMELVSEDGYLLYILPHSFLISESGAVMREKLGQDFYILFLADLSHIPVFQHVGAYVILIIAQRKPRYITEEPKTICVRAREFIGQALQAALDRRFVSTDAYTVFELDQVAFSTRNWQLSTPSERRFRERFSSFPALGSFLAVKQGMVTGADNVFIRNKNEIADRDRAIYRPFLSDRQMGRFKIPSESQQVVFYPFLDEKPIDETTLKNNFPTTWKYLLDNSHILKSRLSIKNRRHLWWRPVWPRLPQNMFRPKLISPHLVLLPKFSIDPDGLYAVSRGPILLPLEEGGPVEMLYYFLAILNSSISHWQLAKISHIYRKGYLKLEKLTLQNISVPDPAQVPPSSIRRIIALTKELCSDPSRDDTFLQLDKAVARIYQLDDSDLSKMGIL